MPAGDRSALQLGDRVSDLPRVHILRLNHHGRGDLASWKRRLHAVVGLHDGQVAWQVVGARQLRMHRERGDRQRDEQPAAEHRGEQRTAQRRAHDRAPEAPAAPVRGAPLEPLADERDAAALDAVAQRGENSGHDRDRAEHRDGDDDDRPDAERRPDRVAREQHARHRDHHRQPGDDHCATRCRRRRRDRLERARAAGSLLALAAQVEERVVDSDGQADEQHDRRDRVVHRQDVAEEVDDPERAHHGRQAEQQRDARGDQRPEGQQQDQQRDRQREGLSLREVLTGRVRDRLLGAGVAELADEDAAVPLCHGIHGVDHWADRGRRRLVAAAQLEVHERRAVVGRDLLGGAGRVGRDDIRDVRFALDASHDVSDCGADARVRHGRASRRLDQDALVGALGEVVIDRALGARGLAGTAVVVALDQARGLPGGDREEDEGQPQADRQTAVPCAPAARSGRERIAHVVAPRLVLHASQEPCPGGPLSNAASERRRVGVTPVFGGGVASARGARAAHRRGRAEHFALTRRALAGVTEMGTEHVAISALVPHTPRCGRRERHLRTRTARPRAAEPDAHSPKPAG